MTVSQEQLDGWLGTGPEERTSLRSGLLPQRLQGLLGGSGCIATGGGLVILAATVAALSAAGYFARTFAFEVLSVRGVTTPFQWGVVGAVIGVIVGIKQYRKLASKGDRLAQLTVSVEELELRIDASAGGLPRLRAGDGRAFRAVLPMGELALPPGRYRIFFVDFAQLSTRAAASDEAAAIVLALEPLA